MKKDKKMTIAEKVVLTAISFAAITFLLRTWDPDFFRYFHMVPMQEVSFLRNAWQTAWLSFQIIVYFAWGISLLWLVIFMIVALVVLAIAIITFILDIPIAIYNLFTWITPLPRLEISIFEIYSDFVEDINFEIFGYTIEGISMAMISVFFTTSIFFILPLVTLFW